MNQAIVMCTLCGILSSSLLENVDAQTRNQPDSWSFIQSMERLSKVVENLQAKIELQELKLNNLVTKEELETILSNNLATKSDVQMLEASVRNLKDQAEKHETKLDELKDLLTNLNSKEEEQVSFLSNLEGQSKLQTTAINRVEADLDNQTSLLYNLANKEEWQQPVPLYATNRTIEAVQGDDVEIWCVVRGIPLPEIKWTRENGKLASSRVEYGNNGQTLRIKNVGWSDEGTYVCFAANGVGSPVSQSVSLEVDQSSQYHRTIETDTMRGFSSNIPTTTPWPTGLFAATEAGLISLDLRTLEATALTTNNTLAVAVNHKLNKVYWTEGSNSGIMRSNFDGSVKEIIVPQTSDIIRMMAIDEPSGKVYFALLTSHEIRVCDALGKNRAAVIPNSSLVHSPVAIALDSDNGVMYWSNQGTSPRSLVRAKLNGSNASIISTGFRDLYGITLDQRSNDVLYWADLGENTIGTIDVNGGNKRTIAKLEGNPGPWGIQVDAHKIYFSGVYSKKIQSVDKGSGKELTTIFNSTGSVYQLALFYVPV